MIEDAVAVEKPEEQRCGNALVAIAERVVFGDEIEQHSSFLFHAGLEFFSTKCLVYLSDTALERVVLLVAKEN